MRKRVWLPTLLLGLLFLFASCSPAGQSGVASYDGQQQAVPGGEATSDGAEIALFLTEEQTSLAFGQAVWNTVSRFAGEEGISYGPYTVDSADADATLAMIELAIKGSARVLVAIGDEMAAVVERAQVTYPDLAFILLNVSEEPSLRSNSVLLEYDELQAGWMAGYAAVLEGYRVLAYVEPAPAPTGEESQAADPETQDPDEALLRRNLGFVLGAEAAAVDLGLDLQAVQVQALHLEAGQNATARRQLISDLYDSGVELLFAADSSVQNDALRVARVMNKGLVGISLRFAVDEAASVASVDQVPGQPLYSLLQEWKDGAFPEERVYYCGLEQEGFVLESTGFDRFTTSQYGALVTRFAGGGYARSLHALVTDEQGALLEPMELETQRVWLVQSQQDEETGQFWPPAVYREAEEETPAEEGGAGEEPGPESGAPPENGEEAGADEPDDPEDETPPDASLPAGEDDPNDGGGGSGQESPSQNEA